MVTHVTGGDASRPDAPHREDAARPSRFADIRWVAETSSTNADVLDLARTGAPEGVVVVADHQTAGRGRRGRSWEAPSGASLLVSVLLRPPAELASLTTIVVGLAAVAAVRRVGVTDAGVKWPNDVVVGDRKAGGILAEGDWTSPDAVAVAAGLGLNVNWPEDLPVELAPIAASLNHLVGHDLDRGALLDDLLRALDEWYGALVAGRVDDVIARWREVSATLGRRVRVDLTVDEASDHSANVESNAIEGLAVDVTREGHLVVETAPGDRQVIAAGDVVHLRAPKAGS